MKLALGFFFWCFALATAAAPVYVDGARTWSAPDSTRVVFDVSAPVTHRVSVLHDPERVVVDLSGVILRGALDGLDIESEVLSKVRSALHDQDTLRVVFDLKSRVRPKSFVLKPNEKYGYRLVLDLFKDESAVGAAPTTSGPIEFPERPAPHTPRDLIVALDAGHGGDDPGAIGAGGTREKDVVMAITRRLEQFLRNEPGLRSVMIRDGDYFVSLHGRKKLARDQKADMFVSIHADSFKKNINAQGASVFAVSVKGASSAAARLLAESENATDIIGGVSLEERDDILTSVLLDLSQTGTIEASLNLGARVLSELQSVGNVHKGRVEQAGFVVLKSLGIPSILVETGFLSNRKEEQKLRDPRYQEAIADAIRNGIRNYFADHAPPGTLFAAHNVKHVIKPGDTLVNIAQQYQINPATLRSVNGLKSDLLEVGRVLWIPQMAN